MIEGKIIKEFFLGTVFGICLCLLVISPEHKIPAVVGLGAVVIDKIITIFKLDKFINNAQK